jgi:hypothetical protein
MFTSLRKFAVIFLSVLQLIAPLVHAHTGEKISTQGLHVPGLEMYNVEHDAQAFQASSHDFRSIGVIVGVDAGMKDKNLNAVSVSDHSHYLHQQISAFNPAVSPFYINFSPQAAQLVCRLFTPSFSPRAPPAQ